MNLVSSPNRTAFLIAHPGHELSLHGWLEQVRPLVCVLTDGSGRSGRPRLARSTAIFEQSSSHPGTIYGRYSDRQIYAAVLQGNTCPLLALAEELAQNLVDNQIETVVGDTADGSILTHDLWRGIINRAIRLAHQKTRVPIANYDFCPEGAPDGCPPGVNNVQQLLLDDGAFQRKRSAIRSYLELQAEASAQLAMHGEAALRVETIFASPDLPTAFSDGDPPPHYELHGQRQVAAGIYPEVIRYQQHVVPILQSLGAHLTGAVA